MKLFAGRLAHAMHGKESYDKNESSGMAGRMLATSSSNGPAVYFTKNGDVLCRDRKTFFEHLAPQPLLKSTVRVVVQQGSTWLTGVLSDQLAAETKRAEKIYQGIMTQEQADDEATKWETEEWGKRWKLLPNRILIGLAKYHATTMLMRMYEHLASQRYDPFTLDKLTKDTFRESKTAAGRETDSMKISNEMFQTSLWANFIAFLADYTVHQAILLYGYYAYMRHRQRRDTGRNTEEGLKGAAAMSLFMNSTQLIIFRALGLVLSSVGGALGTLALPGWGTLAFTNLGDSIAGLLLTDGQAPTIIPDEADLKDD